MSQPLFTPEAEQDLIDIADYLSQWSPTAAQRVLDDIERTCRTLASNPGLGRSREDLGPGLRSMPVGKYIIIFRAAPAQSTVEIIRVLHGRRNIPTVFGGSGD